MHSTFLSWNMTGFRLFFAAAGKYNTWFVERERARVAAPNELPNKNTPTNLGSLPSFLEEDVVFVFPRNPFHKNSLS